MADIEDPESPDGKTVTHPSALKVAGIIFPSHQLHEVPTLPRMLSHEIPEKTVSIWAGEGGIGKSYIAFETVIALAAGRGEFGRSHHRDPTRVLYVDCENGPRLMTIRYHSILKGFGLNPQDPHVLGGRLKVIDGQEARFYLDDREKHKNLMREIEVGEYKLVVLDSLLAMTTVDGNSNKEVRALIDCRLRDLTHSGAAVVGLQHARKLSAHPELNKGAQGILGARAWVDAVDEAFVIRAASKTRLSVEHVKGRTFGLREPFILGLELPSIGTPMMERVARIRDLGRPEEILSALETAKIRVQTVLRGGGLTAEALYKAVADKMGCSTKTVKRARAILEELGAIMKNDSDNKYYLVEDV